jgi:hypothetical protein
VAGSFEHGNKPSGSIKYGEFLDQLSDYQLLKTDSAPWSYLIIIIIIIIIIIMSWPAYKIRSSSVNPFLHLWYCFQATINHFCSEKKAICALVYFVAWQWSNA